MIILQLKINCVVAWKITLQKWLYMKFWILSANVCRVSNDPPTSNAKKSVRSTFACSRNWKSNHSPKTRWACTWKRHIRCVGLLGLLGQALAIKISLDTWHTRSRIASHRCAILVGDCLLLCVWRDATRRAASNAHTPPSPPPHGMSATFIRHASTKITPHRDHAKRIFRRPDLGRWTLRNFDIS